MKTGGRRAGSSPNPPQARSQNTCPTRAHPGRRVCGSVRPTAFARRADEGSSARLAEADSLSVQPSTLENPNPFMKIRLAARLRRVRFCCLLPPACRPKPPRRSLRVRPPTSPRRKPRPNPSSFPPRACRWRRTSPPPRSPSIPAEEMAERQTDRVADALRAVPGISVSQSGAPGQLTSVFTRGLESRHTQVLIDGVPINQGLAGQFNFADLTSDGLSRVEVQRGPQSVLYGPGALAGTIQLFTRRGDDGGSPRAFTFDAAEEGGSFGTFRERVDVAGVLGTTPPPLPPPSRARMPRTAKPPCPPTPAPWRRASAFSITPWPPAASTPTTTGPTTSIATPPSSATSVSPRAPSSSTAARLPASACSSPTRTPTPATPAPSPAPARWTTSSPNASSTRPTSIGRPRAGCTNTSCSPTTRNGRSTRRTTPSASATRPRAARSTATSSTTRRTLRLPAG